MIRAIRHVLGAITSLAGWIVLVVPTVLLAFWSATYIETVLQGIGAPGVPIQYEYLAADGRYSLRAKSYTFDPRRQQIRLNRPEVLDPTGKRVGGARLVIVSLQDGAAFVRISQLEAEVVRRPNGRFSVEGALPVSEGEPSTQPVTVEARNVVVRYVDDYGPGAGPVVAESDLVRVTASADLFAARGDLSVRGGGLVQASLANSANSGFQLRLKTTGFDCSPFLDHAFNWIPREALRDWQPIQADQLLATGEVDLVFPAHGPPRLASRLVATGVGVSARGLLSQATIDARGDIGLESFAGTFHAQGRGTDAQLQGTIGWGRVPGLEGQLRLSAASHRSLWPIAARVLPSGIQFDGARYEGPVRWQGERFELRGEVGARRLAFRGEVLQDSRLRVSATSDGIAAKVVTSKWMGEDVVAAVGFDLRSRRLSGYAKVRQADLQKLGSRLGITQLRGTSTVDVVLGGTPARPSVGYVARGAAAWDTGSRTPLYLGLFEAGGRLDGDQLRLGRFALTSQNGAYTASGSYNTSTQALDFRLKGGALNLRSLLDEASGLAFFEGTIRGTPRQPLFAGNAELYAASLGPLTVPVLRSEVSADRRIVRLTSLRAENGTSSLVGNAAWTLESGKLDGQFSADDLLLADYLGSEFAGAIDAREGTLSGTAQNPTVTATLSGGPISAFGVAANRVEGRLFVDRTKARVEGGLVALAEGSASLRGEYAFDDRRGRLNATLDGIGLSSLPTSDSGVDLGGTMDGTVSAVIGPEGIESGNADLKVAGLVTNGWVGGDGSIQAAGQGGEWISEIGIGTNDRFIVAEGLRYNARDGSAAGDLSLLNIRVEDVLAAVRRGRKNPSDLEQRLLATTTGQATALVSFSGQLRDPEVQVENFTLSDLEVAGKPAGTLTAKGNRSEGAWTIAPSRWTSGGSSVRVQGTIDRDGKTDLNADVDNLDLQWLQALGLTQEPVPAELDSSLRISGMMDNPIAVGSLRLEYTGAESPGSQRPSADFDSFELRDRIVRAEGVFLANSFSGKIKGHAPIATLLKEEQEGEPQPVDVRIDLKERDINELKEAMPWLDEKRTNARLGGWMALGGTPDKWLLSGQATVHGSSLAATDVDATLNDVDARAVWEEGKLQIQGRATGSKGGDLVLDGAVEAGALLESGLNVDEILARSTLSGSLKIDALKIAETFGKGEKAEGTVQSATLQFGGTLRAPVLSGEAIVSGADIVIPTIEEQGLPTSYPVNPRFNNFVVKIDDRARVRAAATVMDVAGQGSLNGTLQEPRVVALLTVLGGTFSLPSAPITLEEGGTMSFRYESSATSEPIARLDLNLEGRTAITARRLSDVAERYEVTLGITGNLLENQGLRLRASSDPPDLSQDEILAILGQKDLIEQLARGTTNNQQPIREMLYSFALPALSSSVTRSLAYGLGLDQLSIEYNAYDNFTFTGSKTLGKGLTLVGRGQLVKPIEGPSRWEMKVYYRLPSRNVILSRTRLGAGIAYDRPWRLTLDYTIRF